MNQDRSPTTRPVAARRFQLVRYFTLTSLGMFLLAALALGLFLRQQSSLFQTVQSQEAEFFSEVQSAFAKQQDEAARRDLLAIHENGNVNLTRLFANALWEKDFAPFVAVVSQIPVDHCRAIADVKDEKSGKTVAPPEKKACFQAVGKQIMAMPAFKELDAKVFGSMKKSTVFKIKVFDLRGITVYSSEHAQIGDDKAFNKGWQSAMDGKPASELTHRDKFSAFEGVVENRDVIGSYLPVLGPGTDKIVGVFEVYSDVTQFLKQINATSAKINETAAANQAKASAMSAENGEKIEQAGLIALAVVAGLMILLFGALYVIVRRADRVIVEQGEERERAQQHLAQAEKMASLGQMVAGVAHQLNTPIAFSYNNVSMAMDALRGYELPLSVAGKLSAVVKSTDSNRVMLNMGSSRDRVTSINEYDLDITGPTEMLSDTLQGLDQMRELVENLRDFTRLDRAKTARVDLNKGLHTVIYIAKSVIPTHVNVVEDFGRLPEIDCNSSQLNQVFLNLINNAAHAIGNDEGQITVSSRAEGGQIVVDVTDTGAGIPADVLPHIWDNYFTTKPSGEGTGLGLPIAKSIVEEHGGQISVKTEVGKGTTFTVRLPAAMEAALA